MRRVLETQHQGSASSHLVVSDARQAQATSMQSDFRDLQITVPIVRPPGWRDVQKLLDAKAVTFAESGDKEMMTVKCHRWGAFVDRQKERLEQEIKATREAIAEVDLADSEIPDAAEEGSSLATTEATASSLK